MTNTQKQILTLRSQYNYHPAYIVNTDQRAVAKKKNEQIEQQIKTLGGKLTPAEQLKTRYSNKILRAVNKGELNTVCNQIKKDKFYLTDKQINELRQTLKIKLAQI